MFSFNFQDVKQHLAVNDCNELNSFKLAIVKALSSLSYSRMGKYTSIKNISVDLPISPRNFKAYFPVEYNYEESFKDVLAITDLNNVFGPNWHEVYFQNSTTRKRVIGLVNIHFRRKRSRLMVQKCER